MLLSNNKVYLLTNVCVCMYVCMYLLSNKESYPKKLCVNKYNELPKQQQQQQQWIVANAFWVFLTNERTIRIVDPNPKKMLQKERCYYFVAFPVFWFLKVVELVVLDVCSLAVVGSLHTRPLHQPRPQPRSRLFHNRWVRQSRQFHSYSFPSPKSFGTVPGCSPTHKLSLYGSLVVEQKVYPQIY